MLKLRIFILLTLVKPKDLYNLVKSYVLLLKIGKIELYVNFLVCDIDLEYSILGLPDCAFLFKN